MRLKIVVEGPTEERFVNVLLKNYFEQYGITVEPCMAKRKGQRNSGQISYAHLKKFLYSLSGDPGCYVTTLFDYYKMPKDMPAITLRGTLYDEASAIETAVNADIGRANVFFHLQLHEYEALLFSDIDVLLNYLDRGDTTRFRSSIAGFQNPEHINNSEATSPSHRIISHAPAYSKYIDGTAIAELIGIDKMMAECPHFATWIKHIKALNQK